MSDQDVQDPGDDRNTNWRDGRSIVSSVLIILVGAFLLAFLAQFFTGDQREYASLPWRHSSEAPPPGTTQSAEPPSLQAAARKAESGQWADAQTLLEQQLQHAPATPGVLHLLAIVAGQRDRDITSALAYRALASVDPGALSDPLIRAEMDASLERVSALAQGFFNAAITADSAKFDRQLVLNRMAAAGQLGLARPFAAAHRLDLSKALITASDEAERNIGPHFAWSLLQAVPDLISDDAALDVEMHRNQLPTAAMPVGGTLDDNGSLTPERLVAPPQWLNMERLFADKPGVYRMQAMGLRWVWYGIALRNLSPVDAYDAYWRGQKLIERSGEPLEFWPAYPGANYIAIGHHQAGPEVVQFIGKEGTSLAPPASSKAFVPQAVPLPRPDYVRELVNKTLPMPVESAAQSVLRKPLSEIEPIDLDSLQGLNDGELFNRLAELGYWYSIAVRTLLVP